MLGLPLPPGTVTVTSPKWLETSGTTLSQMLIVGGNARGDLENRAHVGVSDGGTAGGLLGAAA